MLLVPGMQENKTRALYGLCTYSSSTCNGITSFHILKFRQLEIRCPHGLKFHQYLESQYLKWLYTILLNQNSRLKQDDWYVLAIMNSDSQNGFLKTFH